jgi:hypothetical protein
MDNAMKKQAKIEDFKFDDAMTNILSDTPEGGAFGEIDDLSRRRKINEILLQYPLSNRQQDVYTLKFSDIFKKYKFAVVVTMVAVFVFGFYFLKLAQPEKQDQAHNTEQLSIEEESRHEENSFFALKPSISNGSVLSGKPIATQKETALIQVTTGIDWWMGKKSHGKIKTLTSEKLIISLESGESWFRVNPKQKGPALEVHTKRGKVEVTGTIFMIRTTDSDTTVALFEGKVLVTSKTGVQTQMLAGHSLQLSDKKQIRLAEFELQQMKQQLSELKWTDDILEKAADVLVDQERKTEKKLSESTSAKASIKNTVSSQSLHARIGDSRKKGDWHLVAALYNQLIQNDPNSESAIISRVSLGEIYSTKLNKHKEALRQYNIYIGTGHTTLLLEAMLGKCTTLKLLHKYQEEKECLQKFIHNFSKALQIEDAKTRLKKLEQESHNK